MLIDKAAGSQHSCLSAVCLSGVGSAPRHWYETAAGQYMRVRACLCTCACVCLWIKKREKQQENNGDLITNMITGLFSRLWSHGDQPPWCRAQTIYAWSEFLVWSPHFDRNCLYCALTVTRYCMVTVWQAFLVKIYFVSIIAKFLVEDLSRHEQSMFKCCFTSHLSCLFESDLTSRAQGHAADLSLCFCVWASTPTSSVSIKFIFLFPSA